ncbi:hypothetical protein EVAR_97019_1 [Eumeta japonica]|uniref:Centromere/kinetochore protein zw10 homolog n=1 Tax=Eumeta variegata TaxID=151549 RepID=A0A4C1WMM6_EUMVA|nr:hypothetical protein EVAR_97019_1 [Eumeta japonica]
MKGDKSDNLTTETWLTNEPPDNSVRLRTMTDKDVAETTDTPLDDAALEKLAVEELIREAVQGAARAEIVGPSGWIKESDVWKSIDKIPLISKEIERLKADMSKYLNNCEFEIPVIFKESKELFLDSKSLVEEMENCKHEIQEETMTEILKSIENHDIIANELEKVKFTLNVVYDVVQSGKYFKDYEDCKRDGNYYRAVETLNDLTEFLNNPVDGFRSLAIYDNLKNAVAIHWDELLQELNALWGKMVYWSNPASGSQIHITIKIEDSPIFIDILRALLLCKQLDVKIKEFSAFLLQEVLVPIIHQDCTVFEETDELMTITIPDKNHIKPAYDSVIANIRLLFHFLFKKLNIEIVLNDTIMSMVGKTIYVEFGDMLIKDCLIDTIPNNINELQSYGKITSEIEDFQQFLVLVRFFPNEKYSILQYANDIDVLFAERCSQYFLDSARTIMLKDLSITMSIGVESVVESAELNSNVDDATEEAFKLFDSALPKSLYYFPRCMISKTAQELLDLVYILMEQAVQCSDFVCKRLYITTRLVFELYDAVVPYHHENFLQTIPQYVALFHNNCMFLAHNLLTFGEKWMTLMDDRDVDYPISFVDLVQKLRDLGYKHLTIHMQQQRKQILDNIRSSDLNSLVVKDVLSDNAEQAIRQCLRQLQILKNVWIGVFPGKVFCRLMSTLVNMFIDELIHRVCTVEDISAEMATQLTEIYTIVVKKAPNLFQKPSDIEQNVRSWIKLQELIIVLGGTLKDIEKRWGDGTGPLAVHFRTEELRNLIKALFQNTMLRANLLSKIK